MPSPSSAPAADAHPSHLLEMRGVSKRFAGANALIDVDFSVRRGSVHSLVGQNGAGKSTLMKVAAGAVAPDTGTVVIDGTEVRLGRPADSAKAGLAIMYQELSVLPQMTALDNVVMADPPRRFGFISRRRSEALYRDVAARIHASIPPSARGSDLATSQQQMVELMRILAEERSLVVMDEPTASLGPVERDELHRIIDVLRQSGHGVVLISHDLDEVLSLSDDITVMRDGSRVETAPASSWTKQRLLEAMTGEAGIARSNSAQNKAPDDGAAPALVVRNVRGPDAAVDELVVRRGEILGIAGLVGSGRTELLRTLAGAERAVTGTMELDGILTRWPRSPRQAIMRGISFVPEDRKAQGLLLDQGAALNVVLPDLPQAGRLGFIAGRRIRDEAVPPGQRVGIAPAFLDRDARMLSGGNQQKLMLARWLYVRPTRILLLDEPTRGVDVGAKQEIFATMRALAASGITIIWVSSELDELVEHSERVIVMARNRIVADLGATATVDSVLRQSFRIETQEIA